MGNLEVSNMNRLVASLALAITLFAISIAAQTVYVVNVSTYNDSSCALTSSGSYNWDNGTCGTIAGSFSSNVSCTADRVPMGFICTGTTSCEGDSNSCIYLNSSTEQVGLNSCLNTSDLIGSTSMQFTCRSVVIVPDDIVPISPSAPTAEPETSPSSSPQSIPSPVPEAPAPSAASSSTLSIVMTIALAIIVLANN